jgi:cyclopropane fatty-acyl-phospholipid synthase-like methyltransferase
VQKKPTTAERDVIEFDADETAAFFNKVYRKVDIERGLKADTRLHPRDRIFLDRILKQGVAEPATCRILDFGCGQGRLLSTLLERGYDAEGMEKHDEMRDIANLETKKWATSRPRVAAGDVRTLAELPGGRYDFFVAMGVFQYMTKEEYYNTLAEIRRLLKPKGTLIATYQNALFDLYTFNKYTVDFMIEKIIGPHVSETDKGGIREDLEQLLVNPEKPAYSVTRARDNIFVHVTNPLTLGDHLRTAGLQLQQKFFYEYFGLPPLLADKHTSAAASIRSKFEIIDATAWQGHFMANAFLAQAQLI